ncbi:hypothetical protein FB45DRAFT_1028527 [Roridomyces roridus]|uniref:Uncharacterized protein n=1 Tax=Roridomyces roridus TaxID=1738132 RepID=A0AAD7BR58_9AGAR|nr:hypothetical protein FB45DRAFT_1028527 [Roridomyces roridus]
MSVPQELVDFIVDNLAGDTPNLKSCSLAARTFVHPSQKHIFKQIVLRSVTVCQRFHQLLTSYPHLATLVDELRILTGGMYSEEPWAMSEPTLALVLPLLHIKRISLVGNAPSRVTIDWVQMNQPLKSALAAVFSSPVLESVRIRGLVIQSPAELLSLFSEASRLKSSPGQIQGHRRPQLTSLLIAEQSVGAFTLWPHFLNPRINLSRVTSLTIVGVLDLDAKNKLIDATASNPLRHLAVMSPQEMDFSPALRSLHIFTQEAILSKVRAFFVSCPPDSQLETIVFDGFAVIQAVDDPSLNETRLSDVWRIAIL